MAKSVVAFELRADGNQAEGSVKSLKAQLREAQADVQTLSDKFGATSQEAIKAAQRAAELKDAIGDAKALTDAFNPDRKFQAFSSAIQGVVGGFAALQGAQALFGSESEELEKVLVKVQAAMALSQGINSIMEAKDSFKILATVIKTNVVGAFSSMKAAIASTGIGLLIIGVGLLIEKFMSMSDAAEEAAAAQDKLNESTKRFADIGLKANLDALDREEKIAIARAKVAGKSEDEIFQIQQDYRKRRLELQTGYYNEIKNADAEAAAETLTTIKNGIAEGQAAELDNQAKLKKIREDAAKEEKTKRDAELKKKKDDIKNANKELQDLAKQLDTENYLAQLKDDNERARAQLIIDFENERLKIKRSVGSEENKNNALEQLRIRYQQKSDELEQSIFDKQMEITNANNQKRIDKGNQQREKEHNNELKSSQDKIAILEAEQQQREAIQNAQLGVIDAGIGFLKEIAGKNKALQKSAIIVENAMGIAKMVIANNTANIAALATPQAIATGGAAAAPVILANNIKTAIGIASTIAATAKALAAVGGGSAGTAPNQNGPGPNAPLTPQAQTTNLNQGQINQLASATTRAFVLESDVSGNQERIRRINRAARIN